MTVTTEGTTRSADGTTIAYERSGDGPLVIVVDGASCHRAFGPARPLAAHLAAGLTVITYDRRGRGASGDTPPYAVEREIEDLEALIAANGGAAGLYGISSGALLAMHAAAAGLDVARLALFEPPIGSDETAAADRAFTDELAGLISAGRRGEAVERFLGSLGLPAEMYDAASPARADYEAIAPTLVYDCVISNATTLGVVRSVGVPTLVLDSAGSSEDLADWAAAVLGALADGSHRSLPGEWHMVADDVLAPVLVDFFRS